MKHRVAKALIGTTLLAVLSAPSGVLAADSKPSDPRITQAIERRLSLSRKASFPNVHITTDDGIVTLTGSVDNLLAKDRATALAGGLRGVRTVVNRIEVKPEIRADREIRRDVIRAIAADPAAETYEINVKVRNAVVTLTGTVSSWAEKTLAEKVTRGIKGVIDVDNKIVSEARTDRSDAEIAQDVRARLNWDPRIDDASIRIDVNDGMVSLSGVAGSAAEKHYAYADAWVAGVKRVSVEDVKVEWSSLDKMQREPACNETTDTELRRAITAAFVHDPRVSVFNPEISVENHEVTLTGAVDNLKAKRAAELDAKNTVCVLAVDNRLSVNPAAILPDKEVRKHVHAAIQRDPSLSRTDLGVVVSNGTVSLYGQVGTIHDLLRAEDLASGVAGVLGVTNHIQVRDIANTKTDLEIKQDIQSELWWSPFVDSDAITVTVKDQVATLSGSANSLWEYEAAVSNAYQGGARKVVNDLEITGPEASGS